MFQWLKNHFDWPFSTDIRPTEETITIYNKAYNVDGLKEALARRIFLYKKKFIESPNEEMKSLHYAEALQALLAKMVEAHESVLKREKDIKSE